MESFEANLKPRPKEEYMESIASAIYNGEFDRVIELLERYDSCYGKMNVEEAAQVARIHNALVEAAS